jgi:hypothetical protein
MSIEYIKNIIREKNNIEKLDKNIIKNKGNILSMFIFSLLFITESFLIPILIISTFSFNVFSLFIAFGLFSFNVFYIFTNETSFILKNILKKIYKPYINSLSINIINNIPNYAKEFFYYRKKDINDFKEYYEQLTNIQIEFFESDFNSYDRFLNDKILEFIINSDKEYLKINKNEIIEIVQNNLEDKNFDIVIKMIQEKFNKDYTKRNKTEILINSFEVKKINKNIIQQI